MALDLYLCGIALLFFIIGYCRGHILEFLYTIAFGISAYLAWQQSKNILLLMINQEPILWFHVLHYIWMILLLIIVYLILCWICRKIYKTRSGEAKPQRSFISGLFGGILAACRGLIYALIPCMILNIMPLEIINKTPLMQKHILSSRLYKYIRLSAWEEKNQRVKMLKIFLTIMSDETYLNTFTQTEIFKKMIAIPEVIRILENPLLQEFSHQKPLVVCMATMGFFYDIAHSKEIYTIINSQEWEETIISIYTSIKPDTAVTP